MKKTLYAILGVHDNADEASVRAGYEASLAKLAPDDTTGQMAIKEAWYILGDPRRKARYDASLQAPAFNVQEVWAEDAATPRSRLPVWRLAFAVFAIAAVWLMWHGMKSGPTQPAEVIHVTVDGTRMAAAANTAKAAVANAPLSAEQLFVKASASVVRVNVLSTMGDPLGLGSGVVIDNGVVITNCHVTRAGPNLTVQKNDATYPASVSLADEKHDLCKLSVTGLEAPAVKISTVSRLAIGQKVYAIGSPRGLDLTLSDGMVSSLREGPDGTLVQTTAPISPGSSGGGLFNEFGELVGIITFQYTNGQNLNFAIPADWIASMSSTSVTELSRDLPAARPNTLTTPRDAPPAEILGSWNCYAPLTGRSTKLNFSDQRIVTGVINNQQVEGYYSLIGKSLRMGNSPEFLVEELSQQRMVLSAGNGARLICTR